MQHIFTNIPHEKNNNFCVYVCVYVHSNILNW